MIRSRMDSDMAENFDSLTFLLQLLTPGYSVEQQSVLAAQPDPGQWEEIIAEAQLQDLAPFLYSLLLNLNTLPGLDIPQKEELHQSYLATVAQNMRALHDAESVFAALRQAGIPAAGLKGIYLLEHAYPNIGARSMNDIDLLVRKPDLAACISVLQGLGYTPSSYFSLDDENLDAKHLPPMEKASGPAVEAHWTLLEEDEPFTIDAAALWARSVPAKIANVDALALGVEDLILHLCLHLTYQHYLNLGLRGLLDVAMVIHKFQSQIDWDDLVRIAKSWGSERVTALTLKLVETQLNVPIPAVVFSALVAEGIEPDLLENARLQLFDRLRLNDHFTPDLLELSAQNNLISKVKIGLRRVFIPRRALARIYNVPPNSPKIVYFYWIRVKYLLRNYGKTVLSLQRGEAGTQPARQKAEISKSLHAWMTPIKK